MCGIERVLISHSKMLAELLNLAREKLAQESEFELLVRALVASADAQNGILNRIERHRHL